jgi:hypothetical protein
VPEVQVQRKGQKEPKKAESEGCCCVFQFAGHISSDDCEWIKEDKVQEKINDVGKMHL